MTSFRKIADDLFWYALAMDEKDAQRHYIMRLHSLCYYIPDEDIELRTVVENKIRELSKYYKKNFTIVQEEIQKTEYICKLVKKV